MKEKIIWKYERPNMWISINIKIQGIIDSPIPAYCVWNEDNLWVAAVGYNDLGGYTYSQEAMYACEDHYNEYQCRIKSKEDTK